MKTPKMIPVVHPYKSEGNIPSLVGPSGATPAADFTFSMPHGSPEFPAEGILCLRVKRTRKSDDDAQKRITYHYDVFEVGCSHEGKAAREKTAAEALDEHLKESEEDED